MKVEELINKERSQNAIKKVAELEGVAESVVRDEITEAIRSGFSDPDPSVQKAWENILLKGKDPTPEEFILLVARAVLEEKS